MPDGRVLLRCHVGCEPEEIVAQLGLTMKDLFDQPAGAATERTSSSREIPRKVVATYPYEDEGGRELYQILRYDQDGEKGFSAKRSAGNGSYVRGMGDARRVPYRLPELLASAGEVYLPEGEKDVENLRARGFVATTNPFGAGPGTWRTEFNAYFAGRDVVLLPDNDDKGRQHMLEIGRQLSSVAKSVRVLEIPGLPEKGDVSDFFAVGDTADELRELAHAAPLYEKWASERVATADGPAVGEETVIRLADVPDPGPQLWCWHGYLPKGVVTTAYGDGGVGKSTLAMGLATSIAAGVRFLNRDTESGAALWIDAEQSRDIVRRQAGHIARGMGLSGIPRLLYYRFLAGSLANPEDAVKLAADVTAIAPVLVVVDSTTAASSTEDPTSASAMAKLMRFFGSLGTTVLLIDHVAKGNGGAGSARQFGSVFKHNLIRSSMCVEGDGGLVTMHHVKHNYGPELPPLGIRVDYRADAISFAVTEPTKKATVKLTCVEAVAIAVASGATTTDAVIAACSSLGRWDDKTVKNKISESIGRTIRRTEKGDLKAISDAEEELTN